MRLLRGYGPPEGLLADRPAPPAAKQYWAVDDNGGTLYVSDGVQWRVLGPRNVVLARKEKTTTQGSIQAETIITDLDAFTVTSRGVSYKLRVYIPLLTHSIGTGGASQCRIREITGLTNPTANQGNVQAITAVEAVRNGGGGAAFLTANIPAQAEGTQRTFRVTVARTNTSTGDSTVNADTGVAIGKAYIEAIEE